MHVFFESVGIPVRPYFAKLCRSQTMSHSEDLLRLTVENRRKQQRWIRRCRALEITGPQALNMAEIANAIGEATGKPVRYQKTSIEEYRRGMEAAGLPPFFVDALIEEALERLRHPQSRVELGTHELFGIKPTTFAEFARRHAAIFAGTTT